MPEQADRNQVRRVVMAYDMVTEMFDEGTRVVSGLPDDAEFVRALTNEPNMSVEIIFRSKAFDPVPEGETIPEWDITLENTHKYRPDGSIKH